MARNQLDELLTDVSFVRWVRGQAAPEEELKWSSWVKKSPEHRKVVSEARELLTAFQEEVDDIPSPFSAWEKLERSLDLEEKEFNLLQNQDRQPFWKSVSLLVTVLLIMSTSFGAFAVFHYQFFENNGGEEVATNPSNTFTQEYRTDFGEKVTFRLSDDSKIVLNANSRIEFSSDVEGNLNSTEVWLQGEAWFDITHLEGEQQRTFTVHTDDGSVRVLGTRFAVKTFTNETRAVLQDGEIHVEVARQTSKKADSVVLRPGDMALFSSEKEGVTVEQVNPRIYTSWNEDIWFFEDTSLAEVAYRIEDTFGVDVMINGDLSERKLSGSIKSTNLDVLVEALNKILDVEIERQDQALYIGMNNISQ